MRERKKKILVFGVLAAIFLTGCGSAKKEEKQIVPEQEPKVVTIDAGSQQEEESSDDTIDELSELYVLTKVDTQNRVLDAKRVSDGKWRTCSYTRATYFYDKFGQSVTDADACCGKVVTLKENAQTQNLEEVHFTDTVWEYSEVKNPKIDTENQMITINGEKYFYGSRYWVYSNDSEVNLSDITDQDTLTVTGVDKKIISIRITTGHGTVKLKHTDLFEGGWLKLGDVVCKIKKNMTFTAPEGTFELSVANDGYGDTKSVTIERNKTLEIDLDAYKGSGPKMCTITFHCDVQGAVLRINGEQVDYSQPLQLKYGTYGVSLSADGYDTISQYLIVNSPSAEITLTMTSNGSADSEEGSSADTNNDASSAEQNTVSQPQQVVTPGELAGTLAGTQTGGDTTTTTDGVTDPFADTGKTEEDVLQSTQSDSGSSTEKSDTEKELEKQALTSLVEQITK